MTEGGGIRRLQPLAGDVIIASPLKWRSVTYAIAAICVLAALVLAVGSYEKVEIVSGTIVPDRGAAPVLASRRGIVAEVAVVAGAHVKRGQRLVEIRSEDYVAGGTEGSRAPIEALEFAEGMLADQARLSAAAASRQRMEITARISGLRAELSRIEEQISRQQRSIELAAGDLEDALPVAKKGFVSRRYLHALESDLIQRQQEGDRLLQAKENKEAELAALTIERDRSLEQARAHSAGLAANRAQISEQVAQIRRLSGYSIVAPIDGVATSITLRPGQPVEEGQPAMIIIPAQYNADVELLVSSRGAGFIARGQTVQVSIDAFPKETFGFVPAVITEVSQAAVPRQMANGEVEAVYIVRARLQRNTISAFGQDHPLLSGMQVSARIVVMRQSLVQWLFYPLFAKSGQ